MESQRPYHIIEAWSRINAAQGTPWFRELWECIESLESVGYPKTVQWGIMGVPIVPPSRILTSFIRIGMSGYLMLINNFPKFSGVLRCRFACLLTSCFGSCSAVFITLCRYWQWGEPWNKAMVPFTVFKTPSLQCPVDCVRLCVMAKIRPFGGLHD